MLIPKLEVAGVPSDRVERPIFFSELFREYRVPGFQTVQSIMKTRTLNWNEVIAIAPDFGRPSDGTRIAGRYAGTMTLVRMREIKRIRRGWPLQEQNLKSKN